ncbi:acyltransferase domain-containing protein [Nesterenkonia xinjiangensis]|uniref:[acyl-carrier-protein] S-malonyltransferase n=1 Tax=Nesterenkonia xinjiangensis TaxID=225327 RepID=A0A7Z0KB82_9MICC|nr:[acyl-carrier-protein] S-malonyltransferase [Nesterenkonia xinjiangensis]
MLAIVCPGQGSQTSGFLAPWLEEADSRETLQAWSEVAGTDLLHHGTESDEETIRDTAVAQPLIVAASLLAARALGLAPGMRPGDADAAQLMLAGHSVGEVPAAALAGVLTEEQALTLIRVRAQGMAEAAAAESTSMAAVIGGVEDEVRESITSHGLTPANANGPGQIVAAGTAERIAALEAAPPARARVIPLKVAGAFHTEHMAPAQQALRDAVADFEVADPEVRLLSNRDGQAVASGAEVLDRLVDQVTRPVRWDLCMESMKAAGVTGVLELLPGGTLTGLAKRGLKGVASLAVKSPSDLDSAREFIRDHA